PSRAAAASAWLSHRFRTGDGLRERSSRRGIMRWLGAAEDKYSAGMRFGEPAEPGAEALKESWPSGLWGPLDGTYFTAYPFLLATKDQMNLPGEPNGNRPGVAFPEQEDEGSATSVGEMEIGRTAKKVLHLFQRHPITDSLRIRLRHPWR